MTEFELLKKYAHGEVEVDLAEIGERVLSGEATNFDLAILHLAASSDRVGMWERCLKRWQQVLGPLFDRVDWRYLMPEQGTIICSHTSCMELAINGACYLHAGW